MQCIDYSKIPVDISTKYLSDFVNNPNWEEIFDWLGEFTSHSEEDVKQPLPIEKIIKVKTNPSSQRLSSNVISKVDGSLDFSLPSLSFAASFLAGRSPKLYILPYILLAKYFGASLTIWMEDVISMFLYQRDKESQDFINEQYKQALSVFPNVNVKFTSEAHKDKLFLAPRLIDKIKQIDFSNFTDLLPFSSRIFSYITVYDLLHFLWQLNVFSQLDQHYYMTGANTEAQFKIYKRILNSSRGIIYLPKANIGGNGIAYKYFDTESIRDNLSEGLLDYLYLYLEIQGTNKSVSNRSDKLEELIEFMTMGTI